MIIVLLWCCEQMDNLTGSFFSEIRTGKRALSQSRKKTLKKRVKL
jgi:hypothetical protein